MKRLAIVGGGSWGTALACVLAPRFPEIRLWMHEAELAARMRETRINDVFLPGVTLPTNVLPTASLPDALENADSILSVMPSHFVRSMYTRMKPMLGRGVPLISATKGLEEGTLLRMSEVIRTVTNGEHPVCVLSGPSFAKEVAAGNPTAIVAASNDADIARQVQSAFSGPTFRVYTSTDPLGVEIGAALKNVIAIGAGICDGLNLGHNALAALITRGLAELTRLAVALGGQPETLAGLAGLGDLVLTCTGDLSRNRQVGLKLARGLSLGEIENATPMVAEGIRTTASALALAEKAGIEMPIVQEMHGVISLGTSPQAAIARLMTRALRNEH